MEKRNSPRYLYETVGMPAGEAFLIRRNAAPPGRKAELHYHDHYELMFCITGQLPYRVEGRSYLLQPGTALLICPYQLHHATAAGMSAERIVLRFRKAGPKQWGEELIKRFQEQSGQNDLLILDPEAQRQIYNVLDSLLREKTEKAFGWEHVEEALITLFFYYLYRAASRQDIDPREHPEERLVQRVIEYLEAHLEEDISVEELAGHFYLDRYQLSRSFSRQVGCPPHRYLMYKRLQKAAQLLQDGVFPRQAAQLCGFGDYSNFYRRFCSYFGVSPQEWQKRMNS